jgi:superfamily I DNA and/or RNA helicase/very-short-patch-repair endonuclease
MRQFFMPDSASQSDNAYPDVTRLVSEGIETLRSRLLDLSLGNRLLNYKHSDKSRTHIRIIDEVPEILFDKLNQGRKLTFTWIDEGEADLEDENTPAFRTALSEAKENDAVYIEQKRKLGRRPSSRQLTRIERALRDRVRERLGLVARTESTILKRAKELGINPSYELPEQNGALARRHTDTKIQTLHFREQMETKLSAIRDGDRTLLQDAGINALHCAFGFVEWYENPESEAPLYAPLLFYPVEIDRILNDGRYTYVLESRDGDIEPNITFAELLKKQFGLELPEWESEEEDLNKYLRKVTKLISRERKWKLRRWSTVGLFTFSKLAIYRDLDPSNWVGHKALNKQSILQDLLAGSESVADVAIASEYSIDGQSVMEEPILVTDADSSQHSALIDVLKGKNLVIQGPPGTGKSQTITNIIAAALDAGKTVLFVAEKMAALEVVKNRLDNFGLGHFCLELHSSKTRKSSVLLSLKERLAYGGPRRSIAQLRQLRQACEDVKKLLINYVEIMNTVVGETGLTVHEVLRGNCVRASQVDHFPIELRRARIESAQQLSNISRQELKALACDLEKKSIATNKWECLKNHPWRGLQNESLDFLHFDELSSILSEWSKSILAVQEGIMRATFETGWPIGICRRDVEGYFKAIQSLALCPRDFDEQILRQINVLTDSKILEKYVEALEGLASACAEIDVLVTKRETLLQSGSLFVKGLISEVADLRVGDKTVKELETETEEGKRTHRTFEEACGISERLKLLFGITKEDLDSATLINAAGLLQERKRAELSFRHPDILREENVHILEEALSQKELLTRDENDLSVWFDLASAPTASEIKSAALALRTAGPLRSVLSGECRAARKLYQSISVSGIRPDRVEAARGLSDLATYLQKLKTFEQDDEFKKAAGPFYRGRKTHWKELATIALWARKVRQTFPQSDDFSNHLQTFLLSEEIAKLDEVLAFAEDPGCQKVKCLLQSLPEQSLSFLRSMLMKEKERTARLATLLQNLEMVGLGSASTLTDLKKLCDLVQRVEELKETIPSYGDGRFLVGDPLNSFGQLPKLRETLRFMKQLVNAGTPEPAWKVLVTNNIVDGLSKLQHHSQSISELISMAYEHENSFSSLSGIDKHLWIGFTDIADAPFDKMYARMLFAAENMHVLPSYLDFLRVEKRAQETSLASVIKAFADADIDYAGLENAFEFVFYRSAAESLLRNDPQLNAHSGSSHEQLRERFQKLDREILDLQRSEIARQLMERPVDPGISRGRASDRTGLALINHQIALQRRHVALRALLKRAGKAIQGLKPCFLMSPMSVAQFLEPGGLQFDLVVMDEASQIRPEDAIGAIARGSQVLIVGDPMQLPPTSFFSKVDSDDAFNDEDEDTQDLSGHESILDMARSVYQPIRQLRWHYRSQHESLIAFSNQEFYNNSLIVFPSPHGKDANFGVRLVDVNGVYDASLNPIEAEAVVNAAKQFMNQFPDRSLGIVAMNQPQRELINGMMDEDIFAVDPEAAAYRTRWEDTLEPFFVKNLENVQGDERDVIFISTVYGKDSAGNFYQRFGPINGVYGHRRLNVLFTRAKQQVRVFTSMDGSLPWGTLEDMRWGSRVLRNYLQFARERHLQFPTSTGKEPDSDFERWVIQLLREKGYEVVPQLGVAGYFLDIAIYHPDRPGTFLVGVECDGATYHSARSVRDRDRLRQEILERLHWNIYRIWSTDWFRNPQSEFEKLTEHIEQLRASSLR